MNAFERFISGSSLVNVNIKYEHHHSAVSESVGGFFAKGEYLDLIFICSNNVCVQAHKLVIASVSTLVNNLICKNDAESLYISLPDVDSRIVEILVNLIYEGVTRINNEELTKLKELMSLLNVHLIADIFETNQNPEEHDTPVLEKLPNDKQIQGGEVSSNFCALQNNSVGIKIKDVQGSANNVDIPLYDTPVEPSTAHYSELEDHTAPIVIKHEIIGDECDPLSGVINNNSDLLNEQDTSSVWPSENTFALETTATAADSARDCSSLPIDGDTTSENIQKFCFPNNNTSVLQEDDSPEIIMIEDDDMEDTHTVQERRTGKPRKQFTVFTENDQKRMDLIYKKKKSLSRRKLEEAGSLQKQEKRGRRRKAYDQDKERSLESLYKVKMYPSKSEKKAKAKQLGMTVDSVSRWFNYRRMRDSKDVPLVGTPKFRGRPKKILSMLTRENVSELVEEFRKCSTPSTRVKEELALRIGVSVATISMWFSDTRQRQKIDAGRKLASLDLQDISVIQDSKIKEEQGSSSIETDPLDTSNTPDQHIVNDDFNNHESLEKNEQFMANLHMQHQDYF